MNRNILIIGNSQYKNFEELDFVSMDAESMRLTFDKFHYKISKKENLSNIEILSNIENFVKAAQRESLNIIYFSGHGAVFNGKNYIVGIDGCSSSIGVTYNEIFDIISKLSFGSKFLVVIDACRDGGFFTDMIIPDHVCLFCSSQVSQSSIGIENKGSAFTQSLIETLNKKPNLELREFLFEVSKEFDLTEFDQMPIVLNRIFEDNVYLVSNYCPKNWNGIQQIDKTIFEEIDKTKGDVLPMMIRLSKEYDLPLLLVNYYYEYYQFYQSNLEPFNYECTSTVFLNSHKNDFDVLDGEYYYNHEIINMGELPDLRVGKPKITKKIISDINNVSAHIHNNNLCIKISTFLIDEFNLQIFSDVFGSSIKTEVKNGNAIGEIPIVKCIKPIKKGDSIKICIFSSAVEAQPFNIKNTLGIKCRNLSGKNLVDDDIIGRRIDYQSTIIIN